MNRIISLNGKWKFFVDEDNKGVEREYWKIDYNDSTWNLMELPSNWYLQGLDFNGVVWFRLEFDLDFSEDDQIELIFEGVDYYTKVWVNGIYIGDHEGYFGAFNFQLSGKMLNKKNILTVRCCAPHDPGFPLKKKIFKGGLLHWDLRPGTVSLRGQEKGSGGIWQPISIKIFKMIGIKDVRISPMFQNGKITAILDLNLYNYDNLKLDISIKISINPYNFHGVSEEYEETISLKPGNNKFNRKLQFKEPKFWWTWDLGKPNLYQAIIEVYSSDKGINDKVIRFGLRKLEEKDDSWYLNGIPIFLRGSCYLASCWLSEMTLEKIENDIRLVKDANMNILRNGYHVEPQNFYDVCDREGILIWQDFPMLWDYDVSPARIREACRQMKELVIQFYNHPSIILWCCHCEPMQANQKTLDISLKRTIEILDKSKRRILLAAEHKNHPFVGWYYSTYYNFLTLPGGKNPNEFGAESLPNTSSKFWLDMSRDNWWPINEEWIYRDFQKAIALYLAEILKGHKGGVTLKQFIEYSQIYQAKLLKFGIEAFRRGKGKVHGSILFTFNDAWHSITWSIVDYHRAPKLAYYSVKQAYQPVLCSIELPSFPIPDLPNIQLTLINLREIILAPLKAMSWNEYFTHNSTLTANLWIINDYPHGISNATLKWQIVKENQILITQRFKITIPPSCSKFVKTLKFHFTKEMAYGEYSIMIHLLDNQGNVISENNFSVYLTSFWKKFVSALSRFFGIFKGYFVAALGQEVQIKMILDSALKKYEKLAEKSWCLDA
ncbi:MAG TPA: glycoside hydrolase family 2 TIM barrel-domain containing protein [Candidatus Deferrimicrobium sp.]|nr:glycoside hydrolase family 2 TIM barrel-domain containing protein [Candidatus Deferrimicrobium sp.]